MELLYIIQTNVADYMIDLNPWNKLVPQMKHAVEQVLCIHFMKMLWITLETSILKKKKCDFFEAQ
jgi:hypothetical protein